MTSNFRLNINSITCFLLYLFPISLITGPALPDIIISTSSLLFVVKVVIEKNYKLLNFKLIFVFFILCLYFVIISIFSNNYLLSLESSLFFFRFGFFSLLVVYLINSSDNFLKIFTICLSLTFLLVSIDALFQFFMGYNFLAFTMPEDLSGKGRISGLFGQDLILGSFLSRLLPLLIGLLIYNFYLINKFNFILIFFIVISNTVIFISGERSAFFYCILFNLIALLLSNKYNFQFFISFILSSIIILLFLNFNSDLKFRMYNYTIKQFTGDKLNIPSDNDNLNDIKSNDSTKVDKSINYSFKIISHEHEVLFSKALIIFKHNKFFGIGPKVFRFDCRDPKYEMLVNFDKTSGHKIVDHGCGSHPHNIYLQLLSETGIFGSLPIIFLFFYVIYLFILILKKKISKIYQSEQFQVSIFIYISILIPLWPFIPTGSFFNNWTNSINFLCFGFFLFTTKYSFNKNIIE